MIRLGEKCGFDIPEYKLSSSTRQSIGSLAATFRQLLALKELVQFERENDERLTRSIGRQIRNAKNANHDQNLASIETMRKDLDAKVILLASHIMLELEGATAAAGGSPERPEDVRFLLKPLKCPSCGASLEMPTSNMTRCKFCGMSYSVEEYLAHLGSAMGS